MYHSLKNDLVLNVYVEAQVVTCHFLGAALINSAKLNPRSFDRKMRNQKLTERGLFTKLAEHVQAESS
jgi:hypothetical protein